MTWIFEEEARGVLLRKPYLVKMSTREGGGVRESKMSKNIPTLFIDAPPK